MKLLVGLGNPGVLYKKTRHNFGFMAIDNYANEKGLKFDKKKFSGRYLETKINDQKAIFLKPEKYMNLSGEVIKDFVNYFKISIEDILIICDDHDIDFGSVKLKYKGSSGGHNGLKNIEDNLGTQEYKRLKIGMLNSKDNLVNHVLGKISKEEAVQLEQILSKTNEIIDDYFVMDFEKLMSKHN
jgi:peptidyl-tRNA hydrolase, PTH1 family